LRDQINEDHPAEQCFNVSNGYGFSETDKERDVFVHFIADQDKGDNGFPGSGQGEWTWWRQMATRGHRLLN
jgi:hypothetical protein